MRKFIASFLTKLLEKVTQDSDKISVTPEPLATIQTLPEVSEPGGVLRNVQIWQ